MMPVASAGEAPVAAGDAAGIDTAVTTPRTDRPDRPDGERGGRRSRRGGRRRRRDGGGEAGVREGAGGEADSPESFGDEATSESRSFDFERESSSQPQQARSVEAPPAPRPADIAPVREAAPAPVVTPPAVPVTHEPREWTPSPPSDATRDAPRSEP